jgi:acyl transferase domain-containing protein
MELSALAATFGDNGRRSDEFFVGSIKSNIGHLESASGIAGFIKVILMLERGYILPNADFKTPKSNIDLERSKIRVSATLLS